MSLTGGLSASLTCHLSMGLGGGVAAQSAAWNPGDLTGLVATLLPAESLARGLLWQNTAKTVAATADGDPVRVAVCPYTAVEFTAPSDAARPLLYSEGGGKWSLSFDGVDDRLSLSGFGSSPSTVYAAIRFARLGDNTLCDTLSSAGGSVDFFSGMSYFAALGTSTGTRPTVTLSASTWASARTLEVLGEAGRHRVWLESSLLNDRGTNTVGAISATPSVGATQSGTFPMLLRLSGFLLAYAAPSSQSSVRTYLGTI